MQDEETAAELAAEGGHAAALAALLEAHEDWLEDDEVRRFARLTLKGGHAKAMEVLIRAAELEELPLKRLALEEGDAECLATALVLTGGGIERVELGFNSIGAAGAKAVMEAMNKHASVTELGLASNHLGDEGIRQLSDAIFAIGLGMVRRLDLSSNACGGEGAFALASALSAARDVAEAEEGYDFPLKVLDFSNNRISHSDGEEALRAFAEEAGVELKI